MKIKTCQIDDCENKHVARGLCGKHYHRLWKNNEIKIRTAKERFEEKYIPVTESGCWLWQGPLDSGGYGRFLIKKTKLAHRASWMIFIGQIPDGMCVCHKCDVPSCVNPNHLFLGTTNDNIQDMVNKDRHARGERASAAKITEKQVLAIRSDDRMLKEIAKDYGLAPNTVCMIKKKQKWKHI